MSNFESWVAEMQQWKEFTSQVPMQVQQDILKGNYRPKEAAGSIKSLLEDPLSIQYTMGYKDRRYSLTYDVLKQVVQNLSLLNAIIQTRVNQIASFGVPYRLSKSLGFVVKHKNPGKLTTKGEREMILSIEKFIYNCGAPKPNPHNEGVFRDDFETFLRKIVRDTLTYDQVTFEVVPDRRGTPYEFIAVDASTIRYAASKHIYGPANDVYNRPPIADPKYTRGNLADPYNMLRMYSDMKDRPDYVQIVNGQIKNAYTREELAFGVRNPRTDIYVQGYGYSEIEQLISIITAHLYAEEYNRRFFMQGSAPKGILSIRGDAATSDQLEGLKRQWRANIEGVENAWRTPIIQTEQGVEFINLNASNREMEYGQWMEYLIKISCGVFLIDPAELNFDLSGGVQQTPLFESSSEWKLKASRDRGLKPLLRFIAKLINDHIVEKIDDHFSFDFIGLDELTEQEKHELRKEQIASYMTLNEIRRAEDLPDIDGGDMIMNPSYLQALTVRSQLEQQEQAQAQQGAASGGVPQAQQGQSAPEGGENQDEGNPDYADTFTKSLNTPVLEIDIGDDYDDWMDAWRG